MIASHLRRVCAPLRHVLVPTLIHGCASTSASASSTLLPRFAVTDLQLPRHFSSSLLTRSAAVTAHISNKTLHASKKPANASSGTTKEPQGVFYCLLMANVPRHAHTEDVFTFLSGPNINLVKDDIRLAYTDKFVRCNWYVKFDDEKSYQLARSKSGQHLGTRPVRLEAVPTHEWFQAGHPRPGTQRNCSVLVSGIPEEVTKEDIEKFFRGYRLGQFPINTFYTEVTYNTNPKAIKRPTMKKRAMKTMLDVERHAMVRFVSEEEAWRAQRNKHKKFLINQSVEVLFI
mmetsp:Transcript_22038/g.36764  ORF Transcript_22038/g.36764 Transcript_22038/m.36764 type:complete len:287 (-) Transcript_22038:475-1335(-)